MDDMGKYTSQSFLYRNYRSDTNSRRFIFGTSVTVLLIPELSLWLPRIQSMAVLLAVTVLLIPELSLWLW